MAKQAKVARGYTAYFVSVFGILVSGGCKRVELTPPSSIGLLNPPPETPRGKDSSTRSGL